MLECNKYLRKKEIISKECIQTFADKLIDAEFAELNLIDFLDCNLQGYFNSKRVKVLEVGEFMEGLILVTDGAMIASYEEMEGTVVPALFTAGEFVFLPRLFMSNKRSIHTIETSSEAAFVILPKAAYKTLEQLNFGAKRMIDMVSEDYWNQHYNRERLRYIHGVDKLIDFYNRYPDLEGDQPKVKLVKKKLAAYLFVKQTSFSRTFGLFKSKENKDENQNRSPTGQSG